MRIVAACTLALMLAGCAAEQHKPFVPTAEQSDTLNQYTLCLVKAARASDDRISDAATIGLAILPVCAGDYQRWMDAMTKDMSVYEKNYYTKLEDAHRLELATTAVVKGRRQSN